MSGRESSMLPDARERKEAITTEDHAFVWASAGTGKTHTLILRALYLLLNAPFLSRKNGDEQEFLPEVSSLYGASSRRELMKAARAVIRSLVMTTFTRKAAAEMQTRLYRYLDDVAAADSLADLQTKWGEDPLPRQIVQTVLDNLGSGGRDMPLLARMDGEVAFERLRTGAQALTELAAELQISTIHSLAASILRRHPLQAGIPPTARFAKEDEDDLPGVEDQIIDRWWQQEVLADRKLSKQLAELLQVVSLYEVRLWLRKSYEFRWIPEEAERIPSNDPRGVQQLLEAGNALICALGKGRGSKINLTREQFRQILARISSDCQGSWTDLCRFIRDVRDYFFVDGNSPKAIQTAIGSLDQDHAQYFQSWTDFYLPALRICVAREFGEVWTTWTQFLSRFVVWIDRAVVQQLGLVTFDEMIRLAARVLNDHPHIRRAEQARLRSVLVDEFQDTDPEQLRLLKALLRSDSDSDHEVMGFFVGDTKQSIYRFRGVDVPSIVDFHRHYPARIGCRIPCSQIHLTTSFRSLRPITRFVNHFFERELDLTGKKDELVPFRSGEGLLPEWVLIDSDERGEDFTAGRGRELAAGQALGIIQDEIRDGEEEPSYKDILVLVREATEVDTLVPELQNAGIPAISSGAKTFYRRTEVLDVLNLLIALVHSQDSLAAAAVLRSPLVCLSDPDIHSLFESVSPERLFHSRDTLPDFLPEAGRDRIEALRRLAAGRRERSSTEWLQEVRAFIPTALYAEPGDREGRALVRINRVLEGFQQELELSVTPPLVWLLKQRRRAVEGGWNMDPGEDVTVADESVNAVRVMTIHKAKGLQARFVIVYGWTSVLLELAGPRGRSGQPDIMELTTETGDRLRAFALNWGPLRMCSPDFAPARRQEREAARAEAKRLAYVAATRASDRMVFLCPQSKGSRFSEEIKGLIEGARRAMGDEAEGQAEICDGTLRFLRRRGAQLAPSKPALRRFELNTKHYRKLWEKRYAELNAPGFSPLRQPSDGEHPKEEEIFEDQHYRYRPDGESRLAAGRLVHAYLERHLLDKVFDPDKLERISLGMPDQAFASNALDIAETVLDRFFAGDLSDGSGKSFRDRIQAARVLGREVPVFFTQEEQAWHGVIDLVLQEGAMIRAIDYKTTTPKDPLPEAYVQQERVYTEALRRVYSNRTVTFEFWWLG